MEETNENGKVTIYTVAGCPFCFRTKELFKQESVDYTEYDISQDADKADELIKLTGRALVPVIMIAGETIIGFDKPKIEAAIKKIKSV